MHNTNDMKIKNTTVHERSTIKYQNLKKKRCSIDNLGTYILDRSVVWFGTDTAIKTCEVKPLAYSRPSSFVRHHIIVSTSPRTPKM